MPRSIVDGVAGKDHIVVAHDVETIEQIEMRIDDFLERVVAPLRGAHCFIGHGFDADARAVWLMARRVVEAVTGLRCYSGDELFGEGAQNQIVEKIAASSISILDISDDQLNTCIEAGIARGARVRYELVRRGSRSSPKPFLFRDKEVFFYETPTQLLGLIRKLVLELRRVVS